MKWLGLACSGAGYSLAIWGGVLLYRNAAPDLGTGITIPAQDYMGVEIVTEPEREKEYKEINERHRLSKRGFLLVTVGCALQFLGTLLATFA